MGELDFCTVSDILKSFAHQLPTDVAADAGSPIWLTRLLHNKVYYGAFLSLRCYLLYFDIKQIVFFLGPFLLPFIGYSFFGKRWKVLLPIMLLMPLYFIFNPLDLTLHQKIDSFKVFYWSLALIGVYQFVRRTLQGRKKG